MLLQTRFLFHTKVRIRIFLKFTSNLAVPLVIEETQNTEPTVDFPRVSSQTPAFEIFCDESDQKANEIKPIIEKPSLKIRHVEEPSAVRESPLAKKPKPMVGLTPKSNVSYDEEMLNNFVMDQRNKIQSPELVLESSPDAVFKKPSILKPFGMQQSQPIISRQSRGSPTATIQLRDDDVTVAGSHKSNQPAERATSTPQRAGAPPISDDLTKSKQTIGSKFLPKHLNDY